MRSLVRLCCPPRLAGLAGRVRARLVRDEGMAIVLFAAMLPVLIGMQALTVDITRAFVERRMLQNAVDAGALAAAAYLPTSSETVLAQARQAAVDYAALNGVEIDAVADVAFVTDVVANDRVIVNAARDVNFSFAPMIGVSFSTVATEGGAQIGRVGGMAGVLPLGVEEPDDGFVFGDLYCLKLGSNGGNGTCNTARQGNFHALDIDNTGTSSASVFRDLLVSGSFTQIDVGDTRQVASGNMTGPTSQGIGCNGGGRLNGDTSTFAQVVQSGAGGSYRVLDWSDPHLAILPVVLYDESSVEVLGFGIFFIEDCAGTGAVVGRFIDTMVPGGVWTPLSGTSDYGARIARLIQ